MHAIFPFSAAIVMLLEILPAVSPKLQSILPLGGSHIAQIGVVLGLAFVVFEVTSVLHK